MSQLALPLKLEDHAVFDSFLDAGNEALVAFLKALVTERRGPGGWIYGPAATGKSHLLQAVCAGAGDAAQYLPVGDLQAGGAAILDGLESRVFVCLDDIDAVLGESDWETALFRLANALSEAGHLLVCAAAAAPRECRIALPDLASRFARLPAFQLHRLTDADRIAALQLRARHRGLELPDDTAGFLITRCKRDMATLYALLDRLDSEALKAQRRLTIPFVRQVLNPGPRA